MVFTALETSTDRKEEIINGNFVLLEAIALYGVISRTVSTPPETPSSQGLYIPAANPTGAWQNQHDNLAWWSGNGYLFLAPTEGMIIKSLQDNALLKYASGTWQAIAIGNAVFSTITESRPLAQSDNGVILECESANTIQITLDSTAVSSGFSCTLAKHGTGNIELIVPQGTTLRAIGTKISDLYRSSYIAYKGNNVWSAYGALS